MEAIAWRWPATKVLYYGQDVAPNDDHDLVKAFGRDRIRVSPISETAEIGMAVGAALAGYRPVVELLMAEFMLVAMNQVVNEGTALSLHERRPRQGAAGPEVRLWLHCRLVGQHTGTIYGMFTGIPGLKVVTPATPADAKGLMTTAIRDDNPVVYLLPLPADARARRRSRRRVRGSVRSGRRAAGGSDVTIVAIGYEVGLALQAAETLAAEGIRPRLSIRGRCTARPRHDSRLGREDRPAGLVDQATRHGSFSSRSPRTWPSSGSST